MKIYGVGLSGSNVNIQQNNSNKYSKQNLKLKLEPIRHSGQNLPKLVGSGNSREKSPDRNASKLPKIT